MGFHHRALGLRWHDLTATPVFITAKPKPAAAAKKPAPAAKKPAAAKKPTAKRAPKKKSDFSDSDSDGEFAASKPKVS